MKEIRLFRFALLAVVLLQLSACVYSRVTFPLDKDVQETTLGARVGRANAHIILWLVAWGDAGVEAAAKNGDIQVIRHLDAERQMYLFGAYSRLTTIAYGD